jgi:hypothetical protein
MNDNEDKIVNFETVEELQHQLSSNMVYSGDGLPSWYYNEWVCKFLDLLVLGWIPRYLIDRDTPKVEYTATKNIFSATYKDRHPSNDPKLYKYGWKTQNTVFGKMRVKEG